jgi:hypothetical protein
VTDETDDPSAVLPHPHAIPHDPLLDPAPVRRLALTRIPGLGPEAPEHRRDHIQIGHCRETRRTIRLLLHELPELVQTSPLRLAERPPGAYGVLLRERPRRLLRPDHPDRQRLGLSQYVDHDRHELGREISEVDATQRRTQDNADHLVAVMH